MADILFDVAGGAKKRLKDMGDGTHAEVVSTEGGGGGGGSSEVEVTNFPDTQPVSGPLTNAELRAAAVPVSGPLTNAQLTAQALATAANQATAAGLLGDILSELQTLNAALLTANSHLAAIETNTGTP